MWTAPPCSPKPPTLAPPRVIPCHHADLGGRLSVCASGKFSKNATEWGLQVLNVGGSGVKWSSKRTVIAELEQRDSNHAGGCATCFWVLTLHAWMRSPD